MKTNLLIRGVVGVLFVSSIVIATRATNPAHGAEPLTIEPSSVWWAVPINDGFGSPTTAFRGRTRFTMQHATRGSEGQSATPCWDANKMEQDVWFKFVADETGTWKVSLCATESDFDSRIAVYEFESGPPVSLVTCDDDGCSESESGVHASASFEAELGEAFYIQVATSDESATCDAIMDIEVD